MLTESRRMESADTLMVFCLRLEELFNAGCARIIMDTGTKYKTSNIRCKQLNSSEFNSKSQNRTYLLPQSYALLLIQGKKQQF